MELTGVFTLYPLLNLILYPSDESWWLNTIKNTFSVESSKILDSSFSIIDAVDCLKLVKSRSEIKRLIKSNGVKINDSNYNDNSFSLKNYYKENEIKISIGKKKIGYLKIVI